MKKYLLKRRLKFHANRSKMMGLIVQVQLKYILKRTVRVSN